MKKVDINVIIALHRKTAMQEVAKNPDLLYNLVCLISDYEHVLLLIAGGQLTDKKDILIYISAQRQLQQDIAKMLDDASGAAGELKGLL